MSINEHASPVYLQSLHNGPYNSSIASAASASAVSVYSDVSSQFSDDSVNTALTSQPDYEFQETSYQPNNKQQQQQQQSAQQCAAATTEIPTNLRQNPRRSSTSSTTRHGCPPSLIRQADRKLNFVDNLVDSSTQIVEAIWPTSSVACRSASGSSGVLPLRTFIQETLRRSRTSFSTLQVALYYLVLIKPHIPNHDFTMEQSEDCHATRALQCGRRMFLAALILASKYLQDRNYSARAWSKISGLHTQEINQNEMAFLLAVKWKLHITDDIYHRWSESVMSHTPTQPAAPGGAAQVVFEQQCNTFKSIILKLNPGLDNLEQALPITPTKAYTRRAPTSSHRSILAAAQGSSEVVGKWSRSSSIKDAANTAPIPRTSHTPTTMEPSPLAMKYTTSNCLAPSLGLLPTPRLTPRVCGLGTPAVGAASQKLGKYKSMTLAISQASAGQVASCLDKWPASNTSSPPTFFSTTRRSSLSRSLSNTSSPDSMISDTSRTSRSSSISSASSLVIAPHVKLDVQARCRSAKLSNEKYGLRSIIDSSSVDDSGTQCMTSSPDSYTGLSLVDGNSRSRSAVIDDATNNAAYALKELRGNVIRSHVSDIPASQREQRYRKRNRSFSMDHSLQDSVRAILLAQRQLSPSWSEEVTRPSYGCQSWDKTPVRPVSRTTGKRSCCAAELAQHNLLANLHPALGSPGIWSGI